MNKVKLSDIINNDLYRYCGNLGMVSFVKCLLTIPGFRFTYVLRKASYSKKFSISRIFWRMLHYRYMYKYGFQIPCATKIGKGLYIGHFGNIVINGRVEIGKYCNIHPGVTLGQTNRGNLKGCPIISDRVWIGANAVIVGNIRIGENVLIAPNAFVNSDVPDNSIVVGNPGEIIPRDNATENYINNILEDIHNRCLTA
jgi:serine O-acetyltransferase